jgi:hypothetical protein
LIEDFLFFQVTGMNKRRLSLIPEAVMFQKIRRWLGGEADALPSRGKSFAWIPKTQFPSAPRSRPFPNDPWFFSQDNRYLLPPGIDPRVLFPFLRRLRDYIPDVSAGVWAWVRLCSTPLSYSFDADGKPDHDRAREILESLDRRIGGFQNERERGVDTLAQQFFLSVFTYGAFCGEAVLDNRRRQIERFVVIDPATVRFRLHPAARAYQPYQIQADGSLVKLNPASFFYFGLDTDGLSPYGRSPLLALPLVIRLQQQMINDMARAQHNAGYPAIHFRMAAPEPVPRESPNHFNERKQNELEKMRNEIHTREVDGNLVTFDNIEVRYLSPDGVSRQWDESIRAIGEQVISALHLAPFMIGRNWGTTQSWGTAQYQLLTNNARTVQEGAKRLADWLRNLELILWGLPLKATHQFAPHHHLDAFDRARAFQTSTRTLLDLSEKGMIEPETAKQRIDALLRFL